MLYNQTNEPVFKYISRKYETSHNVLGINIVPTGEYTDTLLKAKTTFPEKDLFIALPDTYWEIDSSVSDIKRTIKDNTKKNLPTFFCQKDNPAILQNRGSFRLDDNEKIEFYCDKPKKTMAESMSCFWGAIFIPSTSRALEYMSEVTNKGHSEKSATILGSKPIWIKNYYDLGTWKEIHKFQNNVMSQKKIYVDHS